MKRLAKQICGLVITLCLCIGMLPAVTMKVSAADPIDMMLSYARDRVGKSGQQLGYTDQWCAFFVCDCAAYAGQSEAVPYNGSAHNLYFDVLDAGGKVVSSPQAGDLVFYNCAACDTNGDNISMDHVGLVENQDFSIEGNLGSSGSTLYTRTVKRKGLSERFSCDGHSTDDYIKRVYVRPAYSGYSHEIDSSYGTSFTAYPKEKITAENIFNAYHSQINSTSWIGTLDLCTIHEVYTDGCCRVTYPIDGGGTKTVYSKISLFNCSLPNSDKPIVSVTDNLFNIGSTINISWNSVPSATSYWIDIWCDGEHPVSQYLGSSTTYSYIPNKIGNYSVYVTAKKSTGDILSDVCQFSVEAFPSNVSVKTKNHSATISWTDVGASSYYMYVYRLEDGAIPYGANQGKQQSCDLTLTPGKYIAYVSAVYSEDLIVSSSFQFSIHDYYATTDKGVDAIYHKDEEVTISVNADHGAYTKCYYVIYYTPNGGTRTLLEQDFINTNVLRKSFSEAGKYECAFGVHSDYGYTESKYASWYVYENTGVAEWNVELCDAITMNFYIEADEVLSETTNIEIEKGGEIVNYTLFDVNKIENANKYKVSVKLAATQMSEIVQLRVIAGQEVIEEETYTIYEYCNTILADDKYSEYHSLVKEMLNYGAMAQQYFGYDTENLANSGITGVANADVPETTEDIAVADNVEALDFYGASLVYRDRIAVRFYFTGDVAGMIFTANGKAYTPVANNGMYYIEVADILPQNLEQQISLTATDSQGNSLTVSYGPMNYMVRMNQKGDEKTQNLMKALYNYYLAAKALSA